jgi:hypothetical protein
MYLPASANLLLLLLFALSTQCVLALNDELSNPKSVHSKQLSECSHSNSNDNCDHRKAFLCIPPQVINPAKTGCFLPPSCNPPKILNIAQNSCVMPLSDPTVVCQEPKVLNTSKTACIIPNTKPILHSLEQQWDIEVGQQLTIPLVVEDAEQDSFKIISSFTTDITLSEILETEPPTVQFQWIPRISHENKIQTIKFYAKETKSAEKYASNSVSVRIRVWPQGGQELASIHHFIITSCLWNAGTLALSGKIIFNGMLTSTEKQDFMARNTIVNVFGQKTINNDPFITTTALTFDQDGNWQAFFSLPLLQVPCYITLQYLNTVNTTHVFNHPLHPTQCNTSNSDLSL